MFFRISKNTRGETLVEVMVSLFVIMISGAAATMIVMTALDTTVTSERYLVAQNLAEDAAEIIKNLRDTNWLRYPLFHDECWLMLDNGNCSSPNQGQLQSGSLTEGNYSLEDLQFELHPSPLDLSNGIDSPDEDYQVTLIPQTEPSDYYRQIAVTYADTDSIEFIVTIEWLDGAKVGHFSSDTIPIENKQDQE